MRVHRLDWRVAGLAIGILLAVAGVIGILLAIGNSAPKPPSTSGIAPVSAHAATGGPGLGHLPGFGSTGGGGASGTVQTKTLAVTPTRGWGVVHKDTFSVFLSDPARKGLLGLESGSFTRPPSTIAYAQSLANAIVKGSTNAKICGKVSAAQVPNGPRGVIVPLCYTIVPQNGRAVQLYTILIAGVAGNVGTAIRLITVADGATLKAFVGEAAPVVSTVHWKLLT